MDIIDFYRMEQKRVHEWMRNSINDLGLDEWHYVGKGRSNTIAFIIWHCVRTEDNILRFILQGRPPIWNEGGWHERLGLPSRVQGTGMPSADARSFHIADTALFTEYVNQVWQEFEAYMDAIQDSGKELSERIVTVKPLGSMTAIQAIGQTCISHLFIHLGEIAHIQGELGKQGLPI
jgi:hypothetical protein